MLGRLFHPVLNIEPSGESQMVAEDAPSSSRRDRHLQDMEVLSKLLKPPFISSFSAEYRDDITRHDDITRTWLFAEFAKWFKRTHSKVFWLRSDEGRGKRAFTSRLRTHLSTSGELLATLFFDFRDNRDNLTARALLNAICYQLAEKYSEVREPLVAAVKSNVESILKMEDDTFFNQFISAPLHKVPPTSHKVILMDVLDEAGLGSSSKERRNVLLFLKKYFRKLPSWVKIYIVARSEDDVATTLVDCFQPLCIVNIDNKRYSKDLKLSISAILKKKMGYHYFSPPKTIVDLVIEKSEGTSVYLTSVFKNMASLDASRGISVSKNWTMKEVEALPDGLDESYRRYCDAFFEQSNKESLWNNVEKLLQLILSSYEPLPKGTAQLILALTDVQMGQLCELMKFIFPLRGEESGGSNAVFVVFHKSLYYWLLDKNRSGRYWVDTKAGHKLFAQRFLALCNLSGSISAWSVIRLPEEEGSCDTMYLYQHVLGHIDQAGMRETTMYLLLNLSYLQAIVQFRGVLALIKELHDRSVDGHWLDDARRGVLLKLLQCLNLASSGPVALEASLPEQLPFQLHSRLADLSNDISSTPTSFAPLSELLAECLRWLQKRNIVPIKTDLVKPGGALETKLHVGSIVTAVTWMGASWMDASLCVNASRDGTLRVWDVTNRHCETLLKGHEGVVHAVTVLSGGEIASAGNDKTVGIWCASIGECERMMTGHEGPVRSVTAMPSGKVVSGSDDSTVRVWIAASGECVAVLSGHENPVRAVVVLSETKVVSGSDDMTIRIWSTVTSSCETVLSGHEGPVCTLTMLTDGRIVSGSKDSTIRVWNVQTKGCERVLKGHIGCVAVVTAVMNDRFVSSGEDKTIRVWLASSGACDAVLTGHDHAVTSLAALPNGILASASENSSCICFWDISLIRCDAVLSDHTNWVNAVAVLHAHATDASTGQGSTGQELGMGTHIVSASRDKSVRVFNTTSGDCEAEFTEHLFSVCCLAAMPYGRCVSGSEDTTLRIWNIATRKCDSILRGHKSWVTSCCVLGGRVISGSVDKTIRIWAVTGGQGCVGTGEYECEAILTGHEGTVTALTTLAEHTFISASEDNSVRVWKFTPVVRCQAVLTGHEGYVLALAVLPNPSGSASATRIVSASRDCTIRIWNISTFKCEGILRGHEGGVTGLAVMGDGSGRLVSGSRDSSIRVWDVKSRVCISSFTDHKHWVTGVACLSNTKMVCTSRDQTVRIFHIAQGMSSDDIKETGYSHSVRALTALSKGRCASASDDHTISIWNVTKGERLSVMTGHESAVTTLTVLPDGRLVSGSEDMTIRIWRVSKGNCEAILRGHENWVLALTILSEGKIASGGKDNTIRIWEVSAGVPHAPITHMTTGKCISVLIGHEGWVTTLVGLSGGRVASGSADKTIRIWAASGECERVVPCNEDGVHTLMVLADDHIASASLKNNSVRIWDTLTGKCDAVLKGYSAGVLPLFIAAYISDAADAHEKNWMLEFLGKSLYIDTVLSTSLYTHGYVVLGGKNGSVSMVDIQGSPLCPLVDIVSADTQGSGYASYVRYCIHVTSGSKERPKIKCVYRRYSDFYSLDQQVKKKKQSQSLPKLPGKRYLSLSDAAKAMIGNDDRKSTLEKYLRELVTMNSPHHRTELRLFLDENAEFNKDFE